MITLAAITLCIVLSIGFGGFAVAEDQAAKADAGAETSGTPTDELHFVSVLTLNGDVVAIDPATLLVTIKGSNGASSAIEVSGDKELENIKPGDHVVVRYFEGGEISKGKATGAVVGSLNDGLVGQASRGKHPPVASVERVDALNQEVSIRGADGSLETIEVTNPQHLRQIKVGDQIVITHAQAAAVSLEKQS